MFEIGRQRLNHSLRQGEISSIAPLLREITRQGQPIPSEWITDSQFIAIRKAIDRSCQEHAELIIPYFQSLQKLSEPSEDKRILALYKDAFRNLSIAESKGIEISKEENEWLTFPLHGAYVSSYIAAHEFYRPEVRSTSRERFQDFHLDLADIDRPLLTLEETVFSLLGARGLRDRHRICTGSAFVYDLSDKALSGLDEEYGSGYFLQIGNFIENNAQHVRAFDVNKGWLYPGLPCMIGDFETDMPVDFNALFSDESDDFLNESQFIGHDNRLLRRHAQLLKDKLPGIGAMKKDELRVIKSDMPAAQAFMVPAFWSGRSNYFAFPKSIGTRTSPYFMVKGSF